MKHATKCQGKLQCVNKVYVTAYNASINTKHVKFNFIKITLRTRKKKKMRRSSFWKKKKLTIPGFEPRTDKFIAHHRNHCSVSIWVNAVRFPVVLYFPNY